MKLCNLLLCLLISFSCATANAQKEGEAWRKGEYEKILTTYPKLYVFPDGRYLITKTFQEKIDKVAFSILFSQQDLGDVKPKGRLPEKFVKKYLAGMEPFNPVPDMMLPPCCPLYDKDGYRIGFVYPPNGCPGNCKKPLQKRGRTYQLNCCLPQDISLRLLGTLQLQVIPSGS